MEEYTNNPVVIQARYLYGPTGLVKELQNNRYYCQDGSGSTALLADSTGHLLEWYRYDLQGTPFFYYPNDTQRVPINLASTCAISSPASNGIRTLASMICATAFTPPTSAASSSPIQSDSEEGKICIVTVETIR